MSEQLGSAAEEAAKLLATLQEKAQEWARARFDGEHLATGSVECQVCPLCQAVAALRQVRPETVQHLLDAGAALVAALSSAVPRSAPAPDSPVQHIDVQGE